MLVIGNGESRKNIDIAAVNKPKIGCNAIHRDFDVDYLICADYKTLKEAANKHQKIYTRKDWAKRYSKYSNVYTVPELPYKGIQRWDDPWHWGSGPYAVLLGTTLSNSRVDLIGFDLYSTTGQVNNIYKDTENYAASNKRAVDPRYWIYQIGKIFDLYPHCEFRIHQPIEWQLPDLWKKSNVEVDTLSILSYIK